MDKKRGGSRKRFCRDAQSEEVVQLAQKPGKLTKEDVISPQDWKAKRSSLEFGKVSELRFASCYKAEYCKTLSKMDHCTTTVIYESENISVGNDNLEPLQANDLEIREDDFEFMKLEAETLANLRLKIDQKAADKELAKKLQRNINLGLSEGKESEDKYSLRGKARQIKQKGD